VIAERVGVRPLAVSGEGGVADWVQLSRKHEIEVAEDRAQLSIFGGKLTDCLNVGDEVVDEPRRLWGSRFPTPTRTGTASPGPEVRERFMQQAQPAGPGCDDRPEFSPSR
jgi:glycerol-3-phosphate dehydrogenase